MRHRRALPLLAAILLSACDRPKAAPVARAPTPPQVPRTSPRPQGPPPVINAGIGVDEAYAAIPHRRTVWNDRNCTANDEERTYLRVVFQVIDEAVAVRVATQQAYSRREFGDSGLVALDRLIAFLEGMQVPAALVTYHRRVLDAMSEQRRFFREWASEKDRFAFAQRIGTHPGVRRASAALHAAYAELMSRYPKEGRENKDAFFDYHCALDFI